MSNLSSAAQKHNGDAFRVPSELTRTPLPVAHVLLTGACGGFGLKEHASINYHCDYIYFGAGSQIGKLPAGKEHYAFHVAHVSLRFIIEDCPIFRLSLLDKAGIQEHFENCCSRLRMIFNEQIKPTTDYGIPTFMTGFFVPMQNPFGRLLPRYDLSNPAHLIAELNRFMYQLIEQVPGVHYIDIDEIAATFGKKFVSDEFVSWTSHNTFMPQLDGQSDRLEPLSALIDHYEWQVPKVANAIWREIEGMYRTLLQLDSVKMVIVDLDDTLWKGVAADLEAVGPHMVETPVWPYGVIEALLLLRNRGILLGVVSRNEEAVIQRIFPEIMGHRMLFDDFVVRQINRDSKADNVRKAIDLVNLMPSNVLFLDDNPIERAEVEAMLPGIRTLGGSPFFWRRILLWSAEMQQATVTSESADRADMVAKQIQRETERASTNREDFLLSLGLVVSCAAVSTPEAPQMARCLELINKTNQFNTTGKRWTIEDINNHFSNGGELLVFFAKDRFTSYGLIGVLVLLDNRIEQLVMSCRVGGLSVDEFMVKVAETGVRHGRLLEGIFTATDKNMPVSHLYSRLGFQEIEGGLWRSTSSKGTIEIPHIQFVDDRRPQ